MNLWGAFAVFGLILTLISIVLYWYVHKPSQVATPRDKPELRDALKLWEPFVMDQIGTPRALKRFANRARFLATDKQFVSLDDQAENLFKLVGFVAIEETGGIDSSAEIPSFRQWKQDPWWQTAQQSPSLSHVSISIIESCDERDWKLYRALATGAKYEKGRSLEDGTSPSEKTSSEALSDTQSRA